MQRDFASFSPRPRCLSLLHEHRATVHVLVLSPWRVTFLVALSPSVGGVVGVVGGFGGLVGVFGPVLPWLWLAPTTVIIAIAIIFSSFRITIAVSWVASSEVGACLLLLLLLRLLRLVIFVLLAFCLVPPSPSAVILAIRLEVAPATIVTATRILAPTPVIAIIVIPP